LRVWMGNGNVRRNDQGGQNSSKVLSGQCELPNTDSQKKRTNRASRKGGNTMKFYKIREMYDNFPKNPKVRDGNIYIGGELLTVSEFNRLPYIYAGMYEIVDIPKSQTFVSFGARFAAES